MKLSLEYLIIFILIENVRLFSARAIDSNNGSSSGSKLDVSINSTDLNVNLGDLLTWRCCIKFTDEIEAGIEYPGEFDHGRMTVAFHQSFAGETAQRFYTMTIRNITEEDIGLYKCYARLKFEPDTRVEKTIVINLKSDLQANQFRQILSENKKPVENSFVSLILRLPLVATCVVLIFVLSVCLIVLLIFCIRHQSSKESSSEKKSSSINKCSFESSSTESFLKSEEEMYTLITKRKPETKGISSKLINETNSKNLDRNTICIQRVQPENIEDVYSEIQSLKPNDSPVSLHKWPLQQSTISTMNEDAGQYRYIDEMMNEESDEDSNDEQPMPSIKFEYIVFERIIGNGEYGQVWKAHHKNKDGSFGSDIAVKRLRDSDPRKLRALREEARMLIKLKNENIITVYDVIEHVNDVLLVIEYCRFGSLKEYLRKNERMFVNDWNEITNSVTTLITGGQFRMTNLFRFSFQIASGMVFLQANKVIHRDLAARNILVVSHSKVKISDFGLSKDGIYQCCGDTPLPFKYLAPETLDKLVFSSKTDVWSFGVLLWEIYSFGRDPYSNINDVSVLKRFIDEGNRLGRPNNCPEIIYKLMRWCWNKSPHDRCDFIDIYTEMKSSLIYKIIETKPI